MRPSGPSQLPLGGHSPGDEAGIASAWTHGHYHLGTALVAADHLARTGNLSLYTYTSPGGYAPAGTDGNNISLLSGMRFWAQMVNGTTTRYATTQASQQTAPYRIRPTVEGGHSEDFANAIANIYYQHAEVTPAYQRTGPFTSGCGAAACEGTPWGIYPHVLFMFGTMEGQVWPYALDTPTLHAPTNLRVLATSFP
jgi:hypothetical protein